KVLVGAAEAVDWIRNMQGKGISSKEVEINWPELMKFKRTFTEPIPKRQEDGYSSAGIVAFRGNAQITGQNTVRIGDEELFSRHLVIATGAKPAKLNIPGEEHMTTSEQFLELDRLPEKIVFVGGGYISFEFAHLAARSGSKVRILHRSARPLPRFDPELVDLLVKSTREIGVDVQLNAPVKRIEKEADHFSLLTSIAGTEKKIEADVIVHGAGRVPDVDTLALEKAGVKFDRTGVIVNEYLQSVSNPAVYAAGDAAAIGPPLTPVASLQGYAVAKNLLNGNHQKPDYAAVPSVVFTIPALASVGLQEKTARERGLKFNIKYDDKFSEWFNSRRIGEKYSGFKVLVEEGTSRILGAHLLGAHGEEVVNLFAFAIQFGLKADNLNWQNMIYSYPSYSRDMIYMI
ncbi:MAG: dihydrolipoyl dehydrogenase family protein, partial [Candidatus Bathyarchaeia archaeon]